MTYISARLTQDKSSSDKRRVIIDLSWPKGQSVNSGAGSDRYLGVDFVLITLLMKYLNLAKGVKFLNRYK